MLEAFSNNGSTKTDSKVVFFVGFFFGEGGMERVGRINQKAEGQRLKE